jgi:prepilin-type processing-associated H-X9-DG protein
MKMRRKGISFWEVVIILGVFAFIASIFFPAFPTGGGRSGVNARRIECQKNLKQIALGVMQYVQDYDEKYPLVNVASQENWSGSLQPYLKSWDIFQCPEIKNFDTKKIDYFYNGRLQRVQLKYLEFPSTTILLSEGIDESPTNYSMTSMPHGWQQNEKSPRYRHLDGSNFAFVDGHVKWYKCFPETKDKRYYESYTFGYR